jgi:hypothetical protein
MLSRILITGLALVLIAGLSASYFSHKDLYFAPASTQTLVDTLHLTLTPTPTKTPTPSPSPTPTPTSTPSPTVTPTPTPATVQTEWKAYTNSRDFYSLSYRSDWVLSQEPYEPQRVSLRKTDTSQGVVELIGTYPEYTIWILVTPNPNNLSAREYYQANLLCSGTEPGQECKKRQLEEVSVSGEKAVMFDTNDEISLIKEVVVSHKNRVYEISYDPVAPDETRLKYYDEFIQVLSTFKFRN